MTFQPPDCQECGACCFALHDRHVRVMGDDHARLTTAEQGSLVRWEGNRAYLRMLDGHCVALAERDGRWACTIYERRPQLCRDLVRGGDACRHEVETRYARTRLPRV